MLTTPKAQWRDRHAQYFPCSWYPVGHGAFTQHTVECDDADADHSGIGQTGRQDPLVPWMQVYRE